MTEKTYNIAGIIEAGWLDVFEQMKKLDKQGKHEESNKLLEIQCKYDKVNKKWKKVSD